MGLYINPHHQKNIFQNTNISEPNQGYFLKNNTAEMIEEQKRINKSLNQSIHGLKSLYTEQENRQLSEWQDLRKQLEKLLLWNEKHEMLETHVLERIQNLDSDHENFKTMLQKSQNAEQRLSDNLSFVTQSQEGVKEKIENYGEIQNELNERMKQQIHSNNKILEKLTEQEENQEGIIKRLDKQEALTEKMTRQLEYFRSILFERASYLSDKIDDVSSYMLKMISKDSIQSTVLLKEKEKLHN